MDHADHAVHHCLVYCVAEVVHLIRIVRGLLIGVFVSLGGVFSAQNVCLMPEVGHTLGLAVLRGEYDLPNGLALLNNYGGSSGIVLCLSEHDIEIQNAFYSVVLGHLWKEDYEPGWDVLRVRVLDGNFITKFLLLGIELVAKL